MNADSLVSPEKSATQDGDRWFRSLIENSSDVTTVLAADGTILYKSPSVERVAGYAPEELIGRNAFDFVHPDDRDGLRKSFDEAVEMPGRAVMHEFRLAHKNGTWRYFQGIAKNLLHDPAVGGVIINSRDVTEHKQAEEAVASSEQRLNVALEAAEMGVWEMDLVTGASWRSLRHDQIFGYETLVPVWNMGILLEHVVADDREHIKRRLEQGMLTGRFSMECRINRADVF
jgi:PAS domain S-box-containing protein